MAEQAPQSNSVRVSERAINERDQNKLSQIEIEGKLAQQTERTMRVDQRAPLNEPSYHQHDYDLHNSKDSHNHFMMPSEHRFEANQSMNTINSNVQSDFLYDVEVARRIEQDKLDQIYQASQNLKTSLQYQQGRCPKCTLKPPCKHF